MEVRGCFFGEKHLLSGQVQKVGLGKEWCDSGPRGKGGLGVPTLGGLPRVLAPTNPLRSSPLLNRGEHVFMSCTSAVSYFLSSLVNYDHYDHLEGGGNQRVDLGTMTLSPQANARTMYSYMHMHMHMRVKFRGEIVPFVTGPYEYISRHTVYTSRSMAYTAIPCLPYTYLRSTLGTK